MQVKSKLKLKMADLAYQYRDQMMQRPFSNTAPMAASYQYQPPINPNEDPANVYRPSTVSAPIPSYPGQGFKPNYRPFSRKNTNYADMNNWMPLSNPPNLPRTITDGNWRRFDMAMAYKRPGGTPDTDDHFKRYQELSNKVAYRYPNPGLPRERQGRIGGSWRHIKEVLGHGGGQICFIDGLVRQYDTVKFNEYLATGGRASRQLPFRPKLSTPMYSMNRHDIGTYRRDLKREIDQINYKPWYKAADNSGPRDLPVLYDAKPPSRSQRPPNTAKSTKYKGFYGLKE